MSDLDAIFGPLLDAADRREPASRWAFAAALLLAVVAVVAGVWSA